MKTKKTVKSRIVKLLINLILIFAAFVSLYPLIWSLYSSFKTTPEILASSMALPKGFYYQNYINAIVKAKMGTYFINSIVITLLSLALSILFTVPTAYAITRYNLKYTKTLKGIFVAGLFVQSTIYLVPLFLLMGQLNILDNRLAICFVYAAGSFPFSIFLLSGFMKSIPEEYEEAAKIDGCGYFRVLWSIIIPMAKPAIVTVVIFNALGFFNEFPVAFTVLMSENKKTLPIGIQNLLEIQRYATDWGALFAGLAIVTIPTILLYALTQKKLTEGVSIGGLKG